MREKPRIGNYHHKYKAHDRYANREINYLLQRIEEYNGLVILATNMKSNIDDAFIRRIRLVIQFPFPSPGG